MTATVADFDSSKRRHVIHKLLETYQLGDCIVTALKDKPNSFEPSSLISDKTSEGMISHQLTQMDFRRKTGCM